MRFLPIFVGAISLIGLKAEISIDTLKNKAYLVTNQVEGIYEGDFFTVFTYDYKLFDVYIDGQQLKPTPDGKTDRDVEETIRCIADLKKKPGLYATQYSVPWKLWTPGEHDFCIYMSNQRGARGHALNVLLIKGVLDCKAIDVLFLDTPTCVCKLRLDSVELDIDPDLNDLD